MQNPAITTTITGIKKQKYIEDSLEAMRISNLSPKLIQKLHELKDIETSSGQ